jgi:hypothetical protein
MADLKACPFCGGEAELDTRQGYAQFPPNGRHGSRIAVYCRECGADIGVCREDVPDIEPEQVAELWNRRAPAAEVGDLAALIRQLVRSLRKAAPSHALAGRAADYLRRKGLQGSPLRAGIPGLSPSDGPAWDAGAVLSNTPEPWQASYALDNIVAYMRKPNERPYPGGAEDIIRAFIAAAPKAAVPEIPSARAWLDSSRSVASKEWIEGWTACRTFVTQKAAMHPTTEKE